jgi:protoporphyrinogen/coproporphyrinogen III oxidase
VITTKSSPAARKRYIFYPDHLVQMPTPLKKSSWSELFDSWGNLFFWREPLFNQFWSGLLRESTIPARDENVKDESLGDFVSRRFGRNVADNLVSAVCHGIYAGDIYKLSARTLQPTLWHLETRGRERGFGILRQLFSNMRQGLEIISRTSFASDERRQIDWVTDAYEDRILPSKRPVGAFNDISVLTFEHGLSQLTNALAHHLQKNRNISIKTSMTVQEVNTESSHNQLAVKCRSGVSGIDAQVHADYVISSLSPRLLRDYLSTNDRLQLKRSNAHWSSTSEAHRSKISNAQQSKQSNARADAACERSGAAVTVMVVNLYYENPRLIPFRGFGYLIPRSVPTEQNEERALGVIFGSETSYASTFTGGNFYADVTQNINKHGQKVHDTHMQKPDGGTRKVSSQDTARGTKLTVMMGGHWWSDWKESDIPTEEKAVNMAQRVLKRHLNIDEIPSVAKARLNKDCIPAYPVGYPEDMSTIHQSLIDSYRGRFKVVGPWWQGAPGMNDCVLSARKIAWTIRDGLDDKTGLEDFMNEKWLVGKRAKGPYKSECTK